MLGEIPKVKIEDLPPVRGRYTEDAPLGAFGWFRTGGTADILFKPADEEDLIDFLKACPTHIPVTPIGVLSNTIIRDNGVPGVVIRFGRGFTDIEQEDETVLQIGAAALDLGAFTGFLYGFNEREHIYDIMDFIAGQRFHPDYTRVGGLMNDLPCEETFQKMVHNFTDVRMPKAIGDIETLLNTNRIFIDRSC